MTPRTPEQKLMAAEGAALLGTAIASLSKRDADIIRMRFGLDPYDRTHPLKEIATQHRLSTARAHKIAQKALQKLGEPRRRVLQAAAMLGLEFEGALPRRYYLDRPEIVTLAASWERQATAQQLESESRVRDREEAERRRRWNIAWAAEQKQQLQWKPEPGFLEAVARDWNLYDRSVATWILHKTTIQVMLKSLQP